MKLVPTKFNPISETEADLVLTLVGNDGQGIICFYCLYTINKSEEGDPQYEIYFNRKLVFFDIQWSGDVIDEIEKFDNANGIY